jgi:lysozyme family protein
LPKLAKSSNYGVTQKTYDDFNKLTGRVQKPVSVITMEEVEAIYGQYWKDAHCSYMPEPLDVLMFDAAINHGNQS